MITEQINLFKHTGLYLIVLYSFDEYKLYVINVKEKHSGIHTMPG